MTTTNADTAGTPAAPTTGMFLLPWINRGLEGLWLVAAFLVPLMFVSQGYVISEAQISYVELPKVALLRTLAGLMALLWLVEWAISSRALEGGYPSLSAAALKEKIKPAGLFARLKDWLSVNPIRWVLLFAGMFFGSILLSTAFSGSHSNSLWGEIPGQDGYSAYTMASYFIVFAVIATHLNSMAQVGRVLGAIVLMGSLVGLYGILQHFGHDFFGLTESTGGGAQQRVTIFMGNTIFAGAVLSMAVPVTLVAATITLRNSIAESWPPLQRLGALASDSVLVYTWGALLAVQLLGLMFTFSRGPWGGAILALAAFLGLVGLSLGWRLLIRAGLVAGLAGIFSVGFLHWQGSVSIIDTGEWAGLVLAAGGIAGTAITLFMIERYGRLVIIVAATVAVVGVIAAAAAAPSVLSGRGSFTAEEAGQTGASTANQLGERITSIKTDVLGGFTGGRGTHWEVSWEIITERPWFTFDDLSLSWLRPIIGYGPDLFRYTYLLKSPPDDFDFLPLEPDHAHNFFIHQTVEQGFIGGFASLALFLSVIGVAAHRLVRGRTSGSPLFRLLLFGLAAVILGRFMEMMVGVARISDLTVLWVLFALFVALIKVEPRESLEEGAASTASPAETRPSRRNRSHIRRAAASPAVSISYGMLFRLAVVAWAVGGIGVVTWQKSVNSVRAGVAEGQAIELYSAGNPEDSIAKLDRAIELAPGVPNYYYNRGQVFLNYLLFPERLVEPGCQLLSETNDAYRNCLAMQSFSSNVEAARQQPFNYRSHIAAGNAAFNLSRHDTAVDYYSTAVSMLPNSWNMRNDLAESLIDAGEYEEAISHLDWSLGITGDAEESTRANYLRGAALRELGQTQDSIASLKRVLTLADDSESTRASLNELREIYAEQERLTDIDYFTRQIAEDQNDVGALFFRGMAHYTLGNVQSALLDFQETFNAGLRTSELLAMRGYMNLLDGNEDGSKGDLIHALESAPQSPLYSVVYARLKWPQGNYSLALNLLDDANVSDPEFGLAYLIRADFLIKLGLADSVKDVFYSSLDFELPSALDYQLRGEINAFFENYDASFKDINQAIQINPNKAEFYNARGKIHGLFGEHIAAVEDFSTAVEMAPSNGYYLRNRGVAYHLLGDTERSTSDFEQSLELDKFHDPVPRNLTPVHFSIYQSSVSSEFSKKLELQLLIEQQALRDIEYHSGIIDSSVIDSKPTNRPSLQFRAEAYLSLGMWQSAINDLSSLIELSPDVPQAYKKRGDALAAVELYQEAIEDYTRAVSLDNSDSESLVALGDGYAAVGNYGLAISNFDDAVRRNPVSSDAYASRGFASVQMGNPSDGLADLDTAIEISPFNHNAYYKRALALVALGEVNAALADLERAINLAPTNTDYLLERGRINVELSDFESAASDFDIAVDLTEHLIEFDPRHSYAKILRAASYIKTGDPEMAVSEARSAFRSLTMHFKATIWRALRPKINANIADALDVKGDGLTALGEIDEANIAYEHAERYR